MDHSDLKRFSRFAKRSQQRRQTGTDVCSKNQSDAGFRRPIFNATLWAAAGWPFFRVARSTRINSDMGASLALEKQPTDLRRRHYYMRDGALVAENIVLVWRMLSP